MGIVRRDGDHVRRPHAGGEQRLVGVAHGGVGEQDALLATHPLGEFLRAELKKAVAATFGQGCCRIDARQQRLRQRQGGFVAALHFRIAVDQHIADELEHARGTVTARPEGEQLRCVVDEAGGAIAALERRMCNDVFQEGQVAGYTADAEFAQGTTHPADRFLRVVPLGGDLDQQGIVVGCDDRAGIGRASIKADAGA